MLVEDPVALPVDEPLLVELDDAQRGPGSTHSRPSQHGVELQNWPSSIHAASVSQIVALQNKPSQHGTNEHDSLTALHTGAPVERLALEELLELLEDAPELEDPELEGPEDAAPVLAVPLDEVLCSSSHAGKLHAIAIERTYPNPFMAPPL